MILEGSNFLQLKLQNSDEVDRYNQPALMLSMGHHMLYPEEEGITIHSANHAIQKPI